MIVHVTLVKQFCAHEAMMSTILVSLTYLLTELSPS
jgi:hypothetical protein